MQTALVVTLGQLLAVAPLLLVYLGGIVLSAIWWRRAPRPAMLALSGLAIMLLITLIGAIVQNWIIFNRGSVSSLGPVLMAVAFIRSGTHAGGLLLLIAAVFVGRERQSVTGFEVRPLPPTPIARQADL